MGFLEGAEDRQRAQQSKAHQPADEQAQYYRELLAAGLPVLTDFVSEARRHWNGAPLCTKPRQGQSPKRLTWVGNPRRHPRLDVTHWQPTSDFAYPLIEGSKELGVALVAAEEPFLVECQSHVTVRPNARGTRISSSQGHVADGLGVGTLIVVADQVAVPLGALPRLDWRVDTGGARHLQLVRMWRATYSKYDEIKQHELRTVLEDTMLSIAQRRR